MQINTYDPVCEGERAGQAVENTHEIESLDNKQPHTGPQNSENQQYTDQRDKNITQEENNNKEKGSDNGTLVPRKRKATEPINTDTPQKTRGKCVDYQRLANPYEDDDHPEMEVKFTEMINIT